MRSLTACLALGLATTAGAQTIDATNPAELTKLFREEGYKAEIGVDSVGDPTISGRISQTNWTLYFYGCDGGLDCDFVQFQAGYDLDNGIAAERINEWNRSKLMGTAYLDDENDPFIKMPVNLDGGVIQANWIDTMDWWRVVIEDFEDHIDW